MTGWIRTYGNGADYAEHLDGVPWHKAGLPRWWHRCQPQTRGFLSQNYVERCRCGAIRDTTDGPWADRNQTRKSRRRKRREAKMPREQVTCRECGEQYEAITGSREAAERLCTQHWAERFVRTGRP